MLHEAVQPVVYVSLFKETKFIIKEQISSLYRVVCIHCFSENTVNMKRSLTSHFFLNAAWLYMVQTSSGFGMRVGTVTE